MSLHGAIRAVTRHYPSRVGPPALNRLLGLLFFDRPEPMWRVAPALAPAVAMELNLSRRQERKLYYFPRPFWRELLGRPLVRLMERRLGAGAIFLDIGANIGLYSLIAARLVGPAGSVMAFEPLAELAETLRRSAGLQGFSHLQCIELALSDHQDRAIFHRARDGSANSLVPETEARGERRYCGSLEVPVNTLDAYLAGAGVDPRRIGLIRIDVEGEEARTVAGMLGTLRMAAFPPVWVEVRGTHASTRAPNTYPLVRQLLAGLGYEPFTWNGVDRRPLGEQVIVGREDVLFLPHRPEWPRLA